MLLVHLATGETKRFDLRDVCDVRAWLDKARSLEFQQTIRAMTVLLNGVSYSFARPDGFKGDVFSFAEWLEPDARRKFKGGERLTCQAGDVRVVLMAHDAQSAARVSISRTGRQCYNPLEAGQEAERET